MARFIDANIFLRHLLNDDPVRSPASRLVFQQIAQGDLDAWTSDLVISEVVFVLSKTYGIARDQIVNTLLPLIQLPNLKIANKRIYSRVFSFYTSLNISYVDCYNAALMEQRKEYEVLSYDTDFDKFDLLTRIEPSVS